MNTEHEKWFKMEGETMEKKKGSFSFQKQKKNT